MMARPPIILMGSGLAGRKTSQHLAITVSNAWQTLTLPDTALLTKGVRYHLVIEAEFANATNYSSVLRNYQPVRSLFRIQDGVYDEAVGRETFSGTVWSRKVLL